MSRSDVPLNDPEVEGMWPDSSGLWMETEQTPQVTPIEVAGQVMFLQVGPRYAWDPQGLDPLTRALADRDPGPLLLPTSARLAATMARVTQVFLAVSGALALLAWSVFPLEFAAQLLGGMWCAFAVYAAVRRGR